MKKKKSLLLFLSVAMAFLASSMFFEASAMDADWPDVEPSGAYRRSMRVEVIERIPLPEGYHEGLHYDGENIWVNNGRNINTWIVSPRGEMLGEIVPPGTFTEGIADSQTPGKFWVTDWDTKKLYRLSVENGRMVPDREIPLDPALPTGVTRADEMLYVMTWTRGITGTRYHLLQLDKEGKILHKMRIKGIPEPSQIAWDGRFLWITSWNNRRVYQVDPLSFKVMGDFISPANETTGLAWDGEFFWITGTNDDLYKIRVAK